MRVASEGGEFNVRVPIAHEQDFSSWVDSEVLIEGVCGSLYNANRQLTGILFYVPRLSFIRVEAPAKEVPLSELLRFAPAEGTRHRVRVRGIVGFQQQGNALFLESQGKGLRVLTEQSAPLEIGDLVDVLGFATMGDSAPMLEDAVVHRLGHENAAATGQVEPERTVGTIRRRGRDHRCEAAEPTGAAGWPSAHAAARRYVLRCDRAARTGCGAPAVDPAE